MIAQIRNQLESRIRVWEAQLRVFRPESIPAHRVAARMREDVALLDLLDSIEEDVIYEDPDRQADIRKERRVRR